MPLAGLLSAYWVSAIEWDSLLSPLPSIFESTAKARPLTCLTTGILLAAVIWLCGRAAGRGPLPTWVFLLFLLPMALLSRLVLLNEFDSSITSTHYEVFVYPIIQDWLGEAINIDQKSQYGMYPLFLRPIWMFTGGPHTLAVSGVMSALLFLAHASLLLFMSRHARLGITAGTFAVLGVMFSLLSFPFWPGDTYYEFFPVRLVFPALAMLFISLRMTALPAAVLAYGLLACGLVWNFESGVVGLVMYGAYCLMVDRHPTTGCFFRFAATHAAVAGAAVLIALAFLNVCYFLRFHAFVDLSQLLLMIKAFSSGIGAAPMPLHGAWAIHLAIYASAVFVGARELSVTTVRSDRERAAALLATAAMGLLWFRYYQGRSMALPLTFVSFPAIMCIGLLADRVLGHLGRQAPRVAGGLAALLGAPVVATFLVWAYHDPVPQRAFSFLAESNPAWANNFIPALITQLFSQHRVHTTDRCVVVAPFSHLAHLRLGMSNPIHAAGMMQFWFDSEIDDLRAALQNTRTRMVVFSVFSEFPSIEGDGRIQDALSQELTRYAKPFGCSLCDGEAVHIYLRKGDDSAERGPAPRISWQHGSATQSSTFGDATADCATDGNTSGDFALGSTSHTGLDTAPWWQGDLGRSTVIKTVRVWNRTDCCSERLRNFWVFVSATPFSADVTLEDLVSSPNVGKLFCDATPCPFAAIRLPFGTQGRYVRIQLEGTGHLCVAEVEVFDE